MTYYQYASIYLISFLIPIIIGIKKHSIIDFGVKMIFYLTIISLLGELVALFAAIKFRNNFLVYNVTSLLDMLILGFYFSNVINLFNTLIFRVIYSISILLFWISSLIYEQSFFTLNSPFVIVEGIVIIGFSILSIDNIVSEQSNRYFKLTKSIHFWFAVVFLFYWCITILQWGLYKYFSKKISGYEYINLALSLISTLVNIAYGILFYLSPKLKQADAS